MVSFPLIRIYSPVTYPDMLPPLKVRLNKKSTTLRLTMIFKQPLNLCCGYYRKIVKFSGYICLLGNLCVILQPICGTSVESLWK